MIDIRFAYSPDTDDAFMVQAIHEGLVETYPFDFEFSTADIQTLNRQAREADYDLTALSVAAYPHVRENYIILPVGASVGEGYGPAVIASTRNDIKSLIDLRGRKIAVPGVDTTAALTLAALVEDVQMIDVPFESVQDVVAAGDVDAGILIHEGQLQVAAPGCRKITDLGIEWNQRFQLPLPLGIIAAKRDLGSETTSHLIGMLRASIEIGFANRQTMLQKTLEKTGVGLDVAIADRYLSLYVNEQTLQFNDKALAGIKKLFSVGAQLGRFEAFDVDACVFIERGSS